MRCAGVGSRFFLGGFAEGFAEAFPGFADFDFDGDTVQSFNAVLQVRHGNGRRCPVFGWPA
jgi:hypothetical protein